MLTVILWFIIATIGCQRVIILQRSPTGLDTGPWFNKKLSSYQYRKSHCGDKTVVKSSYLHNGISYTDKMASLYWINPLVACLFRARIVMYRMLAVIIMHEIKTLYMRINSVQHSKYHGCWWPGSWRRQVISSNGIDYVEKIGSCLTWERISTTCVMSMWRNDIRCKCMFCSLWIN